MPAGEREFGAADDDERAVRCERASQLGEGPPAGEVEYHVVAPAPPAELLARGVDDAVGAARADEADIPCAAEARHLGTERLGQLDGERADPIPVASRGRRRAEEGLDDPQ